MTKSDSRSMSDATLQAEWALIGGLMATPPHVQHEIWHHITSVLREDDFSLQSHRVIFSAMTLMMEEGIPIDIINLVEHLERKGQLISVGNIDLLKKIVNNTPSWVNTLSYARAVHQFSMRRQIAELGSLIEQRALTPQGKNTAELLAEAKLEMHELQKRTLNLLSSPTHKFDVANAVQSPPPPLKYVVGNLPEEPGSYGLIIGPDGCRKSWLALHIAIAAAVGREVAGGLWPARDSGRVIYVTTEDSKNEIWRRLYAMSAMLSETWDISLLLQNIDIIPLSQTEAGMTLIRDTPTGPKETDDLNHMIELSRGAHLIVLDPIADFIDGDDSSDRIGRAIVNALRRLSRETKAGVLVIGHQNKSSMLNRETHQQSLRGSSRVAAGARWVVTLQPLGSEAHKYGVDEKEASRWTLVHEPKNSYAQTSEIKAIYHHNEFRLSDGRVVTGIPMYNSLSTHRRSHKKQYQHATDETIRHGKCPF